MESSPSESQSPHEFNPLSISDWISLHDLSTPSKKYDYLGLDSKNYPVGLLAYCERTRSADFQKWGTALLGTDDGAKVNALRELDSAKTDYKLDQLSSQVNHEKFGPEVKLVGIRDAQTIVLSVDKALVSDGYITLEIKDSGEYIISGVNGTYPDLEAAAEDVDAFLSGMRSIENGGTIPASDSPFVIEVGQLAIREKDKKTAKRLGGFNQVETSNPNAFVAWANEIYKKSLNPSPAVATSEPPPKVDGAPDPSTTAGRKDKKAQDETQTPAEQEPPPATTPANVAEGKDAPAASTPPAAPEAVDTPEGRAERKAKRREAFQNRLATAVAKEPKEYYETTETGGEVTHVKITLSNLRDIINSRIQDFVGGDKAPIKLGASKDGNPEDYVLKVQKGDETITYTWDNDPKEGGNSWVDPEGDRLKVRGGTTEFSIEKKLVTANAPAAQESTAAPAEATAVTAVDKELDVSTVEADLKTFFDSKPVTETEKALADLAAKKVELEQVKTDLGDIEEKGKAWDQVKDKPAITGLSILESRVKGGKYEGKTRTEMEPIWKEASGQKTELETKQAELVASIAGSEKTIEDNKEKVTADGGVLLGKTKSLSGDKGKTIPESQKRLQTLLTGVGVIA